MELQIKRKHIVLFGKALRTFRSLDPLDFKHNVWSTLVLILAKNCHGNNYFTFFMHLANTFI